MVKMLKYRAFAYHIAETVTANRTDFIRESITARITIDGRSSAQMIQLYRPLA